MPQHVRCEPPGVYDRVFNLLCLRRESVTVESSLERFLMARMQLRAVVEELTHLVGVSLQIIHDFGETSGKVND